MRLVVASFSWDSRPSVHVLPQHFGSSSSAAVFLLAPAFNFFCILFQPTFSSCFVFARSYLLGASLLHSWPRSDAGASICRDEARELREGHGALLVNLCPEQEGGQGGTKKDTEAQIQGDCLKNGRCGRISKGEAIAKILF